MDKATKNIILPILGQIVVTLICVVFGNILVKAYFSPQLIQEKRPSYNLTTKTVAKVVCKNVGRGTATGIRANFEFKTKIREIVVDTNEEWELTNGGKEYKFAKIEIDRLLPSQSIHFVVDIEKSESEPYDISIRSNEVIAKPKEVYQKIIRKYYLSWPIIIICVVIFIVLGRIVRRRLRQLPKNPIIIIKANWKKAIGKLSKVFLKKEIWVILGSENKGRNVEQVEVNKIKYPHEGGEDYEGVDGNTVPTVKEGLSCRRTDFEGPNTIKVRAKDNLIHQNRYIYFRVNQEVIDEKVRNFKILINYFDEEGADWSLEYQSTDRTAAEKGVYKKIPFEKKKNDNQWREEEFTLNDAKFAKGQNGGTDFRIKAKIDGKDIHIHKVTIERLRS